MKTFNELKIGDYIFHKCKKLPLLVEPKRIVNIYEFYNETIFEICWFGSYAKCTVTKLHVENNILIKIKFQMNIMILMIFGILLNIYVNQNWYRTLYIQ